jgi:hypothetical protein
MDDEVGDNFSVVDNKPVDDTEREGITVENSLMLDIVEDNGVTDVTCCVCRIVDSLDVWKTDVIF